MSLLRKASIVTTPTSYENGKILSVKPALSLGIEQIENGNFSTDSDWTKGAGWTISGGTANATSAATGTPLSQYIDTGKKYKITYDVVSLSQGAFQVDLSYSGTALGQLVTTTGTFTDIVTSINPALSIRVVGTTTGSIDNVSVKELIDGDFDFTRNSSATRVNSQGLIEDMQILSGDLVSNGDFSQEGSELVTNGDFATDSDWIKNGQVTISGGVAYFDSDGTFTQIAQSISGVSGKNVKVVIEITEYTQGTLKVLFSGGTQQNLPNSIGVHTLYFNNADSDTINIARLGGVTNLKIDNVSVKEVGQDWTLGTGWGIGTNKATSDASVSSYLNQTLYTIGNLYKLKFEVLEGTIELRSAQYSKGTGYYTTGIHEIEVIPTTTSTHFYVYTGFGKSSISNIKIIEITSDTNLPRIDYTGGVGHWLFEPQSSNVLPYSSDFSYWDNNGAVITPNQAISPSGILNASLVAISSAGNRFAEVVSTSGGTYTFSFYIKAKEGQGGVWSSRVIGDSTIVTNTQVNDSSWTRVTQTFTKTGSGSLIVYPIYTIGTTTTLLNAYIWGAQLEQSSFATSIIPTNGEVNGVTRLQDAAFGAGSSDLINSTEGVLYAEIAALANDGGLRLLQLSDGTNANRVSLYYDTTINRIYSNVVVNSVSNPLSGNINVLNFTKVAVTWKQNDFGLWINGLKVGTDTSGSSFPNNTLNDLSFSLNGLYNFFSKTKCVAVFKEALNNDELECLTGEGYDSFNALALANNYTII